VSQVEVLAVLPIPNVALTGVQRPEQRVVPVDATLGTGRAAGDAGAGTDVAPGMAVVGAGVHIRGS
jgi:hypothetical protein